MCLTTGPNRPDCGTVSIPRPCGLSPRISWPLKDTANIRSFSNKNDEASAKVGVLAEIEEAMKMKPEEYLTYFEDFIFVADKEFG
jgi:hypothetical protein